MPKIYNFRLHSLGNCITIGWSCQAKAEGRDGKMVHIVLVEPEIPQNCGNIARTCAATGCDLHLIRPLGFDISDRAVKRAGLDYWRLVSVYDYESLEDFFRRRPEAAEDLWLATTKAPRTTARPGSGRGAGCFSARRRRACRRRSAWPTMTAASACLWFPRPGA